MKMLDARRTARDAKAPSPNRPATAILLDTPDARLVVFRIGPNQAVAPHRSSSSVLLTVIEGAGTIIGPDGPRACSAGDIAAFEPNEIHGMSAADTELQMLATITPRPGSRDSGEPSSH